MGIFKFIIFNMANIAITTVIFSFLIYPYIFYKIINPTREEIKKEKFTLKNYFFKVKSSLQWVIGVTIILFTIIIFFIVILTILQEFYKNQDITITIQTITVPIEQLTNIILKMLSTLLLASTAIELGYMLFTKGPDEAVEPIITGIAAGILIILSKKTPNLNDFIGIGILSLAIAVLFWVKKEHIKDEDE